MQLSGRPHNLIATPHLVFGMLLIIMCGAETAVMYLLPVLFPGYPDPHPYPILNSADGALLTVLSAPFFWWLIVRPLRRQAEQETERNQLILGSLVDAVVQFDAKGGILAVNEAARHMFGYHPSELVGHGVGLIVPGLRAAQEGTPECPGPEQPCFGRRKDGSLFPLECSISTLESGGSRIAIAHDITRRIELTRQLEEQREFLDNLVRQSAVATFVLDPGHRVVIWNRACEALTGVPAEQMLDRDTPWLPFYPQQHPVLANLVISGIHQDLLELQQAGEETYRKSELIPEGLQSEGWFRSLNGRDRYLVFNAAPIRNLKGELLAVIETVEDLTDRKNYQERLEYQSNYDSLTGLPNRNLLLDRVRQALFQAQRSRHEVALLVIDLDNFKLINDTLGHEAGDAVLKQVGARLSAAVRSGDTVAHQGGDEFTVMISDGDLADTLTPFAGKLLQAISGPLVVAGQELVVTGSIGISVAPRDGEEPLVLLKNAEAAMYRAKEHGGASQFYRAEMNARSANRVTLERRLRRALEHGEFQLHYQPKASLMTGRVTGCEALIRWQDPELGNVPPGAFIPLAEQTGLIVPLGGWVLRQACIQNGCWQQAGLGPLPVAVNLSPRQFAQQDIAALVAAALKESALDPRCLELEITEGTVLQDIERVTGQLEELKRLGVTLSMDDFGTGYSSLSYLNRLPFDKLKIDQAFVRGITTDPESAGIAKAVIAMGHSLRLKVIAEGVETAGQLEYLRQQGCDEVQGFYFSPPLPASEFAKLLRDGRQLVLAPLEPAARSVLIVDDEEPVTRALKRQLDLEGYQVLSAHSAVQGLELLAQNRVAVVVTDYRMPGMNGAQFLERVRELHPDTVRLVLSGHADLAAVSAAVNQGGIFKILQKPWQEEELKELVAAAFQQHRAMFGALAAPQPADG